MDTSRSVPVAPSLEPALSGAGMDRQSPPSHGRIVRMSVLAVVMGITAAAAAELLLALINLVTSLAFHGRPSLAESSPLGHSLGAWVMVVPVVGGILVGMMARHGSSAIRGHGIPEAMERILQGESRIAPRLTFLKPVSSAIAIGTGGPFGAEGPIIATGGALGSLLGQLLHVTADERKVLLAAGAAGGMAAVFGTPVSAVLLAIELLLFEYHARSLVPVALAACAATSVRMALHGTAPMFDMPLIGQPGPAALASYVLIGALVGGAGVLITRALYRIEDAFEHLPIHWMWWPALGAVAVGLIGYLDPRTLGVGYDNIERVLTGDLVGTTLLVLVVAKFASWSIALGSGTSGGTLAPLFTIGGGLGALLGAAMAGLLPVAAVDPRVAGLVGMAAIFAGASRALLASVVFAFETTRQPLGLLPLLGGCSAAYLVSLLTMRNTIMTERLARRGTAVPSDYTADHLAQVRVADGASAPVTLPAAWSVAEAWAWLDGPGAPAHQAYPVLRDDGRPVGVVTVRQLRAAADGRATVASLLTRPAVVLRADRTMRDAADLMVRHDIGRIVVVEAGTAGAVTGIVTRSDLLRAHRGRLRAARDAKRVLPLGAAVGRRRQP